VDVFGMLPSQLDIISHCLPRNFLSFIMVLKEAFFKGRETIFEKMLSRPLTSLFPKTF
jgi:hypothetical protein